MNGIPFVHLPNAQMCNMYMYVIQCFSATRHQSILQNSMISLNAECWRRYFQRSGKNLCIRKLLASITLAGVRDTAAVLLAS